MLIPIYRQTGHLVLRAERFITQRVTVSFICLLGVWALCPLLVVFLIGPCP